jgi:hypothetical protein
MRTKFDDVAANPSSTLNSQLHAAGRSTPVDRYFAEAESLLTVCNLPAEFIIKAATSPTHIGELVKFPSLNDSFS